jgi:hypothetical protein
MAREEQRDEDPISLPPERIRRDLPAFVMEDITEAEIPDGTPMPKFTTRDSVAGKLREGRRQLID